MDNRTLKGVIPILILLIVFAFFMGKASQYNTPSKCYSTLQPSRYFNDSTSHVVPGPGYVRIDGKNGEAIATAQTKATGSMRPAIPDFAELLEVKATDVSRGDIVVFSCKDKEIVHRVIDIRDINGTTYYLTKGDNNLRNDQDTFGCLPTSGDIHSKVIGVIYG